jgi:phosphoribosyl 1,2-cyclic phosphodiesterase
VKLWVLGSGSRGNAVLVESNGCRIVIDAGFGPRNMARRLQTIGVSPLSIEACVITHEHTDHSRGAVLCARHWGWSLYATEGTVRNSAMAGLPVNRFRAGDQLGFSRLDVTTVPIPHDAEEPIGVVVTARETGIRMAVCTDLGHATKQVHALCKDVDVLVLESNHDDQMLWASSYPPWLCSRIAGRQGHLSNKEAGKLVRESVSKRLHHLVLAHLSEENNSPEMATQTMKRALTGVNFKGTLSVSTQDDVVGPFLPKGMFAESMAQYSLGL